jgi:hypothetical protein
MTDLDREWLARLSGIMLRFGVAWTMFVLCCLVLPSPAFTGLATGYWTLGTSLGGSTLLGGIVAWFGKKTSAGLEAVSTNPFRYQKLLLDGLSLLVAAGLLASAGGLLRLALGWVQKVLLEPHLTGTPSPWWALLALQGALAVLLFLLVIGFGHVNVNRFSMHAIYRNRLCRAFLGVARTDRRPDPFTGFDPQDNLRLARFEEIKANNQRLFPVINMTLNLTVSSNTAWAERRAASFTATPLTCGSAALRRSGQASDKPTDGAFVCTSLYSGKDSRGDRVGTDRGIRIGTVLTISGAAISPNWGYQSSRLTAFLMTLFNVRLGAWLPNPATATRDDLRLAQPRNSVVALMRELVGSSNDTSQAVYLSDGGHFENLGLYEMLRRRCHQIVVVDAGQDPNCSMFDLGNAIRKAAIDFGIQVRMQSMRIYPRPRERQEQPIGGLGFAVGDIIYPDGLPNGRLIYVKPSFLPTIPADVRAYGATDKAFPHDSTVEQWFTESQFESYRALGAWQMNEILGSQRGGAPMSLDNLFATAIAKSRPPRRPRGSI